jgi:hypothetical protein
MEVPMKQWTTFLLLIWTTLSFSACASVRLREDVFLSQPVWESTQGPFTKLRPTLSAEEGKRDKRQREVQALVEAPALAGLVQQVLKEQLPEPKKIATLVSGQGSAIVTMEFSNPLPAKLAEHPVTQAIVLSMKESYLSTRGHERTGDLPNLRLTHRDFWSLVDVLNQSMLAPYRTTSSQGIQALRDKRLTWEGLFHKYLTAYFNGKYVDRRGASTSKSKLDLTITNETITALESVFLDALWDWAIIGSGLKVPILYAGTEENPTFLIGQPPTLWAVLKDAGLKLPVKFIIERVAEPDKPGISKAERCVITNVSGLAGDTAQGTSGIIVRALGGAHLGFVILAKFSFGDNDTLTKIVDTWTENTARRATEIFVSQVLYENQLPAEVAQLCSGE